MRPEDERDHLDNTIASGIAVFATCVICLISMVYILLAGLS